MNKEEYGKAMGAFFQAMSGLKRVNFSNVLEDLNHGDWVIMKRIAAMTGEMKREDCPLHAESTEEGERLSDRGDEKDFRGAKISKLCNSLDIIPASMSRSLKNLESKGLIIRKVDTDDRRNTFVTLTDKGMDAVREANEKMNVLFDGILEDMGDEKLSQLSSLLKEFAEVAAGRVENFKKN